ncbi:hypothetical protein KKF34_19825 [Myxococcota bacterium]|nr:hypothetical protein [Myxococcota bacterium]MBU1499137.1 hypothetical protein [Myxococcota bacterium]
MSFKYLILTISFFFSCSTDPISIKSPFFDDFNRDEIGSTWLDTIGRYIIIKNRLNIMGGYNHPLWLKRSLPVNVDIEFDAMSNSPDGDLKIELFGDGRSFAFNKGSYIATGYVFCLGGWKNTKSFIAKRNEHAKNLLNTRKQVATIGKFQHWKISSRYAGGILKLIWTIDGKHVLTLKDSRPLYSRSNSFFGFSNWASDSWFDNLKITPAEN